MTDVPRFWELQEAKADRRRFGADSMIVCDNLVKIYQVADLQVVALQGLDLLVAPGEFIALVGASGSGKSTLLNILGGLDTPSAGEATVAGYPLVGMSGEHRTLYRRHVIGYVWQQAARNLFPYLSALENVEMAMILAGTSRRQRSTAAKDLLELVGLADRRSHRPEQLSGGEQQRVAIAVALANDPSVLLADEPTGELDTATSAEVFQVMRDVNRERSVTIVVVTHDELVAGHVNRTVAIRDGRTSTETVRTRIGGPGDQPPPEEYVVLDRVGRLQLPEHYVDALHLERRVRLTLDDDHASVWPDRRDGNADDEKEQE